jgi:hypothetical protein|tara:strand:+ start:7173 stop:7361 length:189 start_codon:yes stop_codon:yes gene_type:complete
MPLTYYQQSRLKNINLLMGEIHDSTNKIYEHLADRENKEVRVEIKLLIKKLENLVGSLEDES